MAFGTKVEIINNEKLPDDLDRVTEHHIKIKGTVNYFKFEMLNL